IGLAQPPPDPVAIDRAFDLTADRKARSPAAVGPAPEHKKRRSLDSLTPVEERLKFGAGGQPLTARESARYTYRRFRPFSRRRFSTLRPPFVFIRSRKPCVFFRRRTLG